MEARTLARKLLEFDLRDAAAWPGGPKVAVNLPAAQFRAGPALVEAVADALAASGLAAARLELEITGGVVLRDTDEVIATLRRLKELGVFIAMDDFGTGYSSLAYLRRFPFDRVKLDRSFVQGSGLLKAATIPRPSSAPWRACAPASAWRAPRKGSRRRSNSRGWRRRACPRGRATCSGGRWRPPTWRASSAGRTGDRAAAVARATA